MVGNFLGDFVRKSQIDHWKDEFKTGFYLHHEIDRFTDSHEIVKQSKLRLVPKYRHYASVIVDIFYDHFLSKNWNQYSSIDLKSFTSSTYENLESHKAIFPERAIRTFDYMKSTDWLFNYQYMEGMEMALSGMARRTKFDSKMELSINDLRNDYHIYEEEFSKFLPEIEAHIKSYLSKNVIS